MCTWLIEHVELFDLASGPNSIGIQNNFFLFLLFDGGNIVQLDL